MTKRRTKLKQVSALIAGLSFCISTHADFKLKDIQYGGFVSQGYVINSGDNDYIGESSEGTFDLREYAVNASYAKGNWRIGAQLFAQKFGDYGNDDITLDWASVDYQPKRWFGIRAGRVKTPRGLYNESLDVDSLRPFILMPQSVYDSRLRDFNVAFNGAMFFGNIDLGKNGDLDYKVYHGDIPIKTDSGAVDYFAGAVSLPTKSIGMESATGVSLFWNTKIDGLRVGYSASVYNDLSTVRTVVFFPGQPDFDKRADTYDKELFSFEYMVGDWTLAAEWGTETVNYEAGLLGMAPNTFIDSKSDVGYISVIRRLGEKFEIGAYYSDSKEVSSIVSPNPPESPDLLQKDYAISLRYNINFNWLVKAEVHLMDGYGKVLSTQLRPQPYESRDDSWEIFALKTTFSF